MKINFVDFFGFSMKYRYEKGFDGETTGAD